MFFPFANNSLAIPLPIFPVAPVIAYIILNFIGYEITRNQPKSSRDRGLDIKCTHRHIGNISVQIRDPMFSM